LISETEPPRPPSGRAVTHRKRRVEETHQLDAKIYLPLIRAARDRRNWGMRVTHSAVSAGFGFFAMNNELHGDPLGVAIAKLTGASFEDDLRDHGQLVTFTPTEPNLGGLRWWFVCPYPGPGKSPCGRRVRILYRPWSAHLFGCRECHGLTYRSRQKHRHSFYEAFERPWNRCEQLVADLRSRSPRRRLRALLVDPSQVLRSMEAFGAARGSRTHAIREAPLPRVPTLAELRRGPDTIQLALAKLAAMDFRSARA
jgi:hypothetical protein